MGANSGFHEAVGDFISKSVETTSYYKKLGRIKLLSALSIEYTIESRHQWLGERRWGKVYDIFENLENEFTDYFNLFVPGWKITNTTHFR